MKTAGWAARLVCIVAFVLFPGVAFAEISPEWFALASRGPVRSLVSVSARFAVRRLQRPECAAVLSDFRDGDGRLLSDNLAASGLTAPEYFSHLHFVDGGAVALCRRSNVAAAANPGSPEIAICLTNFERVLNRHRGLAVNLLIHEMLHALGLGENPPTSLEITRQVVKRCGPGLD